MPDCDECGTDYPSPSAAARCADMDRDEDRQWASVVAHKQPRHRIEETNA